MLRRLLTVQPPFITAPLLRSAVFRRLMSGTSSQSTGHQVLHDETSSEFYILTSNNSKAKLQYNLVDGVYDMYHTYVPTELRGAGLARVLADHAFEFVSEAGGKMRLTCSYLDHIHKKNPDSKYSGLVVE